MSRHLFDLTGRVAIVTGSSRGLGQSIARGLGEAGAAVVISARSAGEVETTAREFRDAGIAAAAVPFDASVRADCQRLIDETIRRFGKLDVIVVNHGVSEAGPAVDVGEESWQRIMDINLKGAFNCAQHAARQMIAQGTGGSIIFVSSTASLVGFRNLLAYGASKGGVDQMMRQMAVEWGTHNIRVNAINPGYTTHDVRGTESRHADPALNNEIKRMTPMERRGTPEEFVGPAIFLASDASSFVTGVALPVDGGYCAM